MPETDDPLGSEPEPDWATKLTFSIAGEVRRHRARLGMSAQQLSDKCAELGMPIQRSVLSNLESNRRTTITIAEILVLAAALQVPPGVLIFPAGYFNYAEVTPGRSVPAQAAVGWLAGTIRFGNEDPAFYHSHPFFKVRRHDELGSASTARTRSTPVHTTTSPQMKRRILTMALWNIRVYPMSRRSNCGQLRRKLATWSERSFRSNTPVID